MGRKKIDGKIICCFKDRYGEITIADNNGIRSLYFGEAVLQSCMKPDQPENLLMDYSQAMMSAMIFRDKPESALLIGLGGGGLINFLHWACPDCSIDAVEISDRVISLAHEYFCVPKHNTKVAIFHAAGEDFVKQQSTTGQRYDLIMIDAFDESGPAEVLTSPEFLVSCRKLLNEDGIFVINLWTRPKDNFPFMYDTLKTAFGGNTLKLLLGEAYKNAVVLAFNNPAIYQDLSVYRTEAKRLQEKFDINFPKFLKYLYWQNSG